MRTCKVTRGPHYGYPRAALWRWHNKDGTLTLLERNSFYTLVPAEVIVSYRQVISGRLYVPSNGTCSLPSQALLKYLYLY